MAYRSEGTDSRLRRPVSEAPSVARTRSEQLNRERPASGAAKRARRANSRNTVVDVSRPFGGTSVAETPTAPRRSSALRSSARVAKEKMHSGLGTVASTTPPVQPGEFPWTAEELREVRQELGADADQLRSEITVAETEIADLLGNSGQGTEGDQADTGAETFAREQELSLARNSREMLVQTERALQRIADGVYGICESCAQPIGKARLLAFPRATLCVSCKQRQERR